MNLYSFAINKKKKMNHKLTYIKPEITFTVLEIEYSIAAGSASVLATDENFQIFEDWTEEPDVSRTIDW